MIGVLLLMAALPVGAQMQCDAIVQQALLLVNETCTPTARNQACHGYVRVEADPSPGIEDFRFALGDIVDIHTMSALRTSPLNEELGEWGVALLRVQANLPDVLPGTNATFLIFGGAQIDSIDPQAMRAFRLLTGVMGTRCEALPPDGLLLETPYGFSNVEFSVNSVDFTLRAATSFIQAQPGDAMTVSVLDGSVMLTVDGASRTAHPGEMLRVPMTDDLTPAGPIEAPVPYDMMLMSRLPLTLLDHRVAVVPAARTAEAMISTPVPTAAAPATAVPTTIAPAAPAVVALSTAEPVDQPQIGDQAGNSDNVFSGNCGQGDGVGVGNGCEDDGAPPQPPVIPPGHGGQPPGRGRGG